MTTYVSAVPLTMVRLVDGGYHNVFKDEPIAGTSVDPDNLKRLVRKGYLVEKTNSEASDDDGSKPASVKEILAEVGDDKDKAAEALAAEQGRGDDARSSLVGKLQAVLDA